PDSRHTDRGRAHPPDHPGSDRHRSQSASGSARIGTYLTDVRLTAAALVASTGGLPLLQGRLHALAVLGGSDGHGLVGNAGIHDCSRYTLQLEIREHLGPANGVAGTLEKPLAERIDRAIELGRGQAVVDEPELFRLLRRQQLAGQEILLGTGEADALWPD